MRQTPSVPIHNSFVIFTLSVLFCCLLLIFERGAGIEWDYHPDARTYIEYSKNIIGSIDLIDVPGVFFYIVVDFFNGSVETIMTFNILLYSFTNVMMVNFYRKLTLNQRESGAFILLFLLVVFNPYRMHLSLYVLKDTIIIFAIISFVVSRRFSWMFFILLYLMSVRTLIYIFALLTKNNGAVLILILATYFSLLHPEMLPSIINLEDAVNMQFREYDRVPNFYDLGVFGSILRAIIWPFLLLTGLFVFISPALLFIPLSIGSFFLQLWHYKKYKSWAFYMPVYLSMGILAFMVSGFTSFVRYALPLMTILPLLIIKHHVK